MNRLLQSERLRRLSAVFPGIGIPCVLSLQLMAGSSSYFKSSLKKHTLYSSERYMVQMTVKIRIRRTDQKKAHWEQYSDHETTNGKHAENKEVRAHFDNDERADISLHLK